MLIPLPHATVATSGTKAATLAALHRRGFAVPAGFVIPYDVTEGITEDGPADLHRVVDRALTDLGAAAVAVRSSAADEDTTDTSAAGQYDTVLEVEADAGSTLAAVRTCLASRHGPRSLARRGTATPPAPMAVLVQAMVDAEVAGVLFTPTSEDADTVIECTPGLGVGVVDGTVTPQHLRVLPDGSLAGGPDPHEDAVILRRDQIRSLTELGCRIAQVRGRAQDIEWAISGNQIWVLQSRPVTAVVPASVETVATDRETLRGAAGSPGTATGRAVLVHGPADFDRVRPGDVLVCAHTSPAWTPLLRMVSAVVTQTGGVLSHAAIVAREAAIPAVLGVPGALSRIVEGDRISVDGTRGIVQPLKE
ncbi:MAG TPA: pyruvate, phosphate dikinase [Candidatus Avipropionibacterium avicola]|uniref:Pyruvate, phosphate dikinase n=1 Tax=Candidatus Avipropionibacterium avicola TaxID=2840701 RepID=A0A9D1GW45_9ACTN|nr:pyruvate, phosphate dikinase [Candidatus Avipropionibacterium avicola]